MIPRSRLNWGRVVLSAFLIVLMNAMVSAATYSEWVAAEGLTGADGDPDANPDGDSFVNALEYLFVLDPEVEDSVAAAGVAVVRNESGDLFVRWPQRVALDSGGEVILEVSDSLAVNDWTAMSTFPAPAADPMNPEREYLFQYVNPESSGEFYRLKVDFPFAPDLEETVLVGSSVGAEWDSMGEVGDVYVRQVEPPVSASDDRPNTSKYPSAVGTERVSFTEWLSDDYADDGRSPQRRSWMGWFLWGDGAPPPGKTAGWPFSGDYDDSDWDYFVYQFPAGNDSSTTGDWNAVRVDQQPLYMQPLRLNYNWAPGLFGYENQPMRNFPDNTKFWKDKTIVRGINLSPNYPYFVQYGDRIDDTGVPAWPDDWRESWIRMKVRPLETLVLVPSNLTADELLTEGDYNNVGSVASPDYEVFPYPVWNTKLAPSEQTPYAILTDQIGDWHADIVYEGTRPGADGYESNRYRRSDFSADGLGNYLKLTVAQGSPFVWGETNNSRYMIFYDLIRENTIGRIDNNTGSDAEFLSDGPYPVPGVSGVSYVLAYGNQTNPNQWFLNVEPEFSSLPDPSKPEETVPGGFNPPGEQSNHTYFAIYFRTDAVEEVSLGSGENDSDGTDANGNPYFQLEFKDTGKNWFVVGQVPVARYYDPGVSEDDRSVLDQAAKDWADQMGKYAFNFPTDTSIDYSVTNMYRVDTDFNASFANPYVEIGATDAAAMTADPAKTVWTLRPHHYQPLTLGPDLSTAAKTPVVWEPLQTTGIDFPAVASPPNANKTNTSTEARWGYWHPQGNLKPVIAGNFSIAYPFQNFLPVLPPPNWEKNYEQTGIQVVRITNVGTGYERITGKPQATLTVTDPGSTGSGATFDVKLEPNTGRILQVDVVSPGSGYPDGNPPPADKVQFTIDPPQSTGGVQAEGRVQIGGGKVLAVFLNEKGSGYRSTVEISQTGNESVDPPIVVPNFDPNTGQMVPGLAKVISGGSGFNFAEPIQAKVIGTGSGATVEVAEPGQVFAVVDSLIAGFNGNGIYPSSGNLTADAANIEVNIVPATEGGSTPDAEVILTAVPTFFNAVVENPGSGYDSAPTGSITDDEGKTFEFTTEINGGQVIKVNRGPSQPNPVLTTPKAVTFTGGNPDTAAAATAYPGATITGVRLTGPAVGGYTSDSEVTFSGGAVGPGSGSGTFEPPVFDFSVSAGKLVLNGFDSGQNGAGFWGPARFRVKGGKGFRAAAEVFVNEAGVIENVRVLRQGSNYPSDVDVYLTQGGGASGSGATFDVTVTDGKITGVEVTNGGTGYNTQGNTIQFMAVGGGDPVNQPAKGAWAEITADPDGSGGLTNATIVNDPQQGGYLDSADIVPTVDSPPLVVEYFDVPNRQMISPNHAQGYITRIVPGTINVEQVIYDSLITEFTSLGSANLKPFGGGFGGASAPDGYGLGNQLSATSKFIGTLFQLRSQVASEGQDLPNLAPSSFARAAANTLADSYELPIYRDHNPGSTLTGALETSVQALQRTLSLLHSDPAYSNNPPSDSTTAWKLEYYTGYDSGAGRMLINPTASLPAQGIVSRTDSPPEISSEENDPKVGLAKWKPGMLWSGFGVSDQWNDQHYFFGYYLGTAGLAALFDGSWLDSIPGEPENLWSHPDQMGQAIDQWYLSVANDPDNATLTSALNSVPEFSFQKFPFFDQWSGHGWATGIPPGPAGSIENGTLGSNYVPWSIMVTSGTGVFGYGDENENSIWEGLQSFSAAILWGAGTDRKPLVDTGMYLLSTGMAAGDLYFQDKNYNLSASPQNEYSWVPVTTVDSSAVANNGGNNSIPAGTDYNSGAGEAFYTAPEFFGGEAAAGMSMVRKFGPTLNNFFYAFPTGSKFIEAYPPTAWTLGISRNTDYMKKWAGAMMREEWTAARDSALFQPANWLAMAMTSALSGVPYNPGDVPYPMTGTTPNADAPAPYSERLWSSWVTMDAAAGDEASMQPAFKPVTVLHFLQAFEEYGNPDWTYIGKSVNSGGAEVDEVVLMAAFTKEVPEENKVITTFVAFNPGWEERYAQFDRLDSNGSVGNANVSGLITIPAKKMAMKTVEFTGL
ncbi:hypothetical protein [Puniceicoccus vermicola]|uniref:Uncharacterized protein n=1 Tax=Puniceicoccus vermicola TaxID=388746 RepID=A0A7X1E3P0_9BACT|nr:hypothetical protein [Puniceicoccus vermicola]MBC2601266.1 hypothetical protein [Puniceicoccus vermicola]